MGSARHVLPHDATDTWGSHPDRFLGNRTAPAIRGGVRRLHPPTRGIPFSVVPASSSAVVLADGRIARKPRGAR
eukprot:8316670-Alexandrium_andersonii.AAC.1